MKLTKGQFKEITNWHRGAGIIILNTTADFDLRASPGSISSISINQGRDGKWHAGANGTSIEEALNNMINS